MRLLGEVAGDTFVGGSHGIVTFLPVHGADFAVLLEVLEGVDNADALFDGATEWHVVHDLVTDDSVAVDEEETTVGNHFTFNSEVTLFIVGVFSGEYVVVVGDGFVGVGNDRVVDTLDAAFAFWSLEPCPVSELGIG